jgi:hypothetical protein
MTVLLTAAGVEANKIDESSMNTEEHEGEQKDRDIEHQAAVATDKIDEPKKSCGLFKETLELLKRSGKTSWEALKRGYTEPTKPYHRLAAIATLFGIIGTVAWLLGIFQSAPSPLTAAGLAEPISPGQSSPISVTEVSDPLLQSGYLRSTA